MQDSNLRPPAGRGRSFSAIENDAINLCESIAYPQQPLAHGRFPRCLKNLEKLAAL